MADPDLIDDEDAPLDAALNASLGERLEARIDATGVRLDKALADAFPALSRARLQALLANSAVRRDGQVLTGGSAKARPGLYTVVVPPPTPATPAELTVTMPTSVAIHSGSSGLIPTVGATITASIAG